MSYRRPNTGSYWGDYFAAMEDFNMLSHHLLEEGDQMHFVVWLEKLLLIDRRALLMLLRQRRDEIPPEYMKVARYHYCQEI